MLRRGLVRILVANGFVSKGGTKHEKFARGSQALLVPRHRELNDITAKAIIRQANKR